MRTEPTWRIPIGIIVLILGVLLYAGLIAHFLAPLVGQWPALAQLPLYIVLGVVWLAPLRRFLIWMETGRWR
jgi:hypothetical protein